MVVISRPTNVGSVISLSSLLHRLRQRRRVYEHKDNVRSRLVFLTKGTIRVTGEFEV
jgi:hypothetical protein